MSDSQELIVITRNEFTYSELRRLAVDVMKRLLERCQEEFDEFDIMCNFLARGTTCMRDKLLLERDGEGDYHGMLGRHLMELLAVACYVVSDKDRVVAFRKYSHIQYEKAQNNIMQARQKNPGYSREAFERSKHILKIVRRRMAKDKVNKRDRSWMLPKMNVLFTSPEFSELIGGELDRRWYKSLYYYPSMLYVHTTAYTGGEDRDLLLNNQIGTDKIVGDHYMISYYLLLVLSLKVIGEDDRMFQIFAQSLLKLRDRVLPEGERGVSAVR